MHSIDWNSRVIHVLDRIHEDRWAYPASKYLNIVDDVVAGELNAEQIRHRHGSMDIVMSALSHVTMAIFGKGKRPATQ